MTLSLYFIHMGEDIDESVDQHFIAESAQQAVQIWLSDAGLMGGMGFSYVADPSGDVHVWEIPISATKPTAVQWDRKKLQIFTLIET